MNVFKFENYKAFIRHMIATHPVLGRGGIKKIAEALRVHPSLISQVLSGLKDLTSEQGNELAIFFDLSELETEYFLCLIDIERAGTARLKSFLQAKLTRLAGFVGKSQSSGFAVYQNSDCKDADALQTQSLSDKNAGKSEDKNQSTVAVSRRHSRTISVRLSDQDKENLRLMIDGFVAKLSAVSESTNSNQVSVVMIDLFDIN